MRSSGFQNKTLGMLENLFSVLLKIKFTLVKPRRENLIRMMSVSVLAMFNHSIYNISGNRHNKSTKTVWPNKLQYIIYIQSQKNTLQYLDDKLYAKF